LKVAIFGGCGFIGSNLAEHLADSGHQVLVIDHRESTKEGIPHFDFNSLTVERLVSLFRSIEVIYYLHWLGTPQVNERQPHECISSNIGKLSLTLEALSSTVNPPRFIYVSSGGAIYGDVKGLVSEREKPKPIGIYGFAKLQAEQMVTFFSQKFGLNSLILRPSNPYGRSQRSDNNHGIIQTILRRAISGEEISIWGDGSIVRDYLFIDDLILALAHCIDFDRGAPVGRCEVYNIGSGVGHSINALLDAAKEVTSLDLHVVYRENRDFDVKRIVLDPRRFSETFAWKARISLNQGIETTWIDIKTDVDEGRIH
jgi:UDP-glucose 4-epimerase